MQATAIYEKIIRDPMHLAWKDIFIGGTQKHTQRDIDYAMIAGTTLDSVESEIGMLQKWQRPWLYKRVFFAGMAAFGIILTTIAAMILGTGWCLNTSLNLLLIILPPAIVPVTLMVFFWEMNAPRNISLAQLVGYFFSGGVLSMLVSLLIFNGIPGYAEWAPVAEEPGKLAIVLMFLSRLQKKNGKVFGLNGLVIGAAVGAGFAAFESAQYAYQAYGCNLMYVLDSNSDLGAVMANGIILMVPETLRWTVHTIGLRGVCAICSHVMFCAPYACLAALYMERNSSPLSALVHPDFLICFLFSGLIHFLWNSERVAVLCVDMLPFLKPILAIILIELPIATLLLWISCRYGMRKSFAQLCSGIHLGSAAITTLRIQGLSGIHAGIGFTLTKAEILIGSDASCNLNYPVGTSGIAPRHCKLLVQNGQLYLADLGSHSGTWLNGAKLRPGTGYPIKHGDRFSLGSNAQTFVVL